MDKVIVMHHKTMEYFAFTWKIYCLVHMITKTRQWCRVPKTGKTVWLKSSYLIYNEKHCIHWDEWLFNIFVCIEIYVYINFHNFMYIVVIIFCKSRSCMYHGWDICILNWKKLIIFGLLFIFCTYISAIIMIE